MNISHPQAFWPFVLLALMVAAPVVTLASAAPDASKAAPPVLVIVDIQNFYFAGGRLPLVGCDAAGLKAKQLLELFRAKKWPVVHVRHLSKGVEDAPLAGASEWSFQANVVPAPGEAVVTKHEVNGFRGTNLEAILKGLKAKDLVIIGMQTHMCLEGTVRAAADLGYSVTVAQDACATRDLEYDGKKIPAEAVHLSTLATLKGNYARILDTNELTKELVAGIIAAPGK